MKTENRSSNSRLLRAVGGVTLALGLIVACIVLFLVWRSREISSARNTICQNNLKQIGLALANYDDVHGRLPPLYTMDSEGNARHSWRSCILPFMEASSIHAQIDFSTPWDSSSNEPIRQMAIPGFVCYETGTSETITSTHYLALTGPDTCFSKYRSISIYANASPDLRRKLADCILVIECPGKSVHWSKPEDVTMDELVEILVEESRRGPHPGGWNALMGDMTIRVIPYSISEQELRSMTLGNE